MNPVKLGIRNHHEMPVDAAGLQWFVHVPGGKFVRSPMYAPSLTLSFGMSVWVSSTQIAPCMAEGGQLNEW